jgi:hypothetical protein
MPEIFERTKCNIFKYQYWSGDEEKKGKIILISRKELSEPIQPTSSNFDFDFDMYEEQFKRRFKRQLKQRVEAKLRKNADAIFDLIDECLL